MAGSSSNGTDYDLALVRYNADGSLDESFGRMGKITTGVKGIDEFGYSVAVQADGRILLAGSYFDRRDTKIILMRFMAE